MKNLKTGLYQSFMMIEIIGFEQWEAVLQLTHHFLIQTVRIPKTESPSLRKIIQIALNIGQYLAFNNKTIIKRVNINDYINKKDSNTKLSDILSTKDITKIKNILS